MIITDDISRLRIKGKPVKQAENMIYKYNTIIFSIDYPHEVVTGYKDRISFTFPVYGIYDPYHKIPDFSCRDIFQKVLEKMDDKKLSLEKIQGYIRSLEFSDEDYKISSLLKHLNDDETEDGYFRIKYTTTDGEKKI